MLPLFRLYASASINFIVRIELPNNWGPPLSHQANTDMPLELIEDAVMEWLAEASMPEDLDDGDAEDEWIHQTNAWVEAHSEKRDAFVYD